MFRVGSELIIFTEILISTEEFHTLEVALVYYGLRLAGFVNVQKYADVNIVIPRNNFTNNERPSIVVVFQQSQ